MASVKYRHTSSHDQITTMPDTQWDQKKRIAVISYDEPQERTGRRHRRTESNVTCSPNRMLYIKARANVYVPRLVSSAEHAPNDVFRSSARGLAGVSCDSASTTAVIFRTVVRQLVSPFQTENDFARASTTRFQGQLQATANCHTLSPPVHCFRLKPRPFLLSNPSHCGWNRDMYAIWWMEINRPSPVPKSIIHT